MCSWEMLLTEFHTMEITGKYFRRVQCRKYFSHEVQDTEYVNLQGIILCIAVYPCVSSVAHVITNCSKPQLLSRSECEGLNAETHLGLKEVQ